MKKEGKEGGRTGKVVMIKVVGHRVVRHDRATLKIKAKWPILGRLPHSAPQSGSRTPLQIPLLETGLQHKMMKM